MERLTGFSPRKIIAAINWLIAEVRSLQPKSGAGIRINKRPAGTVYDIISRSGGTISDKDEYSGSFKVTMQDGLLNIGEGFLLRNGDLMKVSGRDGISPQQGWLCVVSLISGGEFTEPEIKFQTVSNTAAPVAYIQREQNGGFTIMQMPVSVAVIIAAKPCAMSKE